MIDFEAIPFTRVVSDHGDRVEVAFEVSLVIRLARKSPIVLLAIIYFCIFMPTSGSQKVLQVSKILLSQLWMSTDIVLVYPLRCFFTDQALSNFVVFGLFQDFFALLFSGTLGCCWVVVVGVHVAFRHFFGLPEIKN